MVSLNIEQKAILLGSARNEATRAAISINAYLWQDSCGRVSNIFLDSHGNITMQKDTIAEEKPLEQHVVIYEELMHVDYFERKTGWSRKNFHSQNLWADSRKSIKDIVREEHQLRRVDVFTVDIASYVVHVLRIVREMFLTWPVVGQR